MADEKKPKLSEEEKIARKIKLRRIFSNVLIVVAAISILIFIVMAYLTKGNIDTQTTFDTNELRSKLRNVISLEIKYFSESGKLAPIPYMGLCKEIPRYNPNIDSNFKYKFDVKTGTVTGIEKDASHDVNGDSDGRDGLTLNVFWEAGKTDESDFFWTDEEIEDFKSRQTSQGELQKKLRETIEAAQKK